MVTASGTVLVRVWQVDASVGSDIHLVIEVWMQVQSSNDEWEKVKECRYFNNTWWEDVPSPHMFVPTYYAGGAAKLRKAMAAPGVPGVRGDVLMTIHTDQPHLAQVLDECMVECLM